MRMLLDDLVGEGTLQVHVGKHQLRQLQACLHRNTGVSVHLLVQSGSFREPGHVHAANPTQYPVSAVNVVGL